MSSKYKRICYLCGKEYKYCSSCRDYKLQPSWKGMFDSENCNTLFNLSTRYAQGFCSLEEAKAVLAQCDLSNIDSFRSDVVEQINIIQNSKPTVIEEKVDEQVETKDETKDETKVSQKENVEAKDVLPEAATFRKKKKSMKKTSDKSIQ